MLLTRLWDEHVEALPDNVRMLDLATGNGAVARICATRAAERRRNLEIDAIDAAEIDPLACMQDTDRLFGRIRFHGKTRIEALPFRDRTFLSVVSQFGFEYACETRAAAEVARVMAPGGRLRLVIHAKSGAVTRDIGWRLARMHSVLVENGPVSLVLELVRAYEAGDDRTINSKSQHLPASLELIKRFRSAPLPDDSALYYSYESLLLWAHRKRYRPADLRCSIEHAWTNINDMAVRQEQMLGAARSREDMERLHQLLTSFGLSPDAVTEVLDRQNVQVAWRLDANKPV
jgi:ubiquinone/menaquinone biosynthesis C-methylase UbiE